jgi:catechol 2,3-dioxygenase-like lactoylglutathione lyase family enzyme
MTHGAHDPVRGPEHAGGAAPRPAEPVGGADRGLGGKERLGRPLRVGNASGFYGDRFAAVREMLEGGPLDVLTGDYLAELTMLILGRDRMRDPDAGYARTVLRQMEECLGTAVDRGVRVVTNAGGLNPAALAARLTELADRLGVPARIGHVEGDDLLGRAEELDLGEPLTANAYLGAWGIAECLRGGADVVVTGRVTDASLVVGPAAAHFGWRRDNWDALAGATVAGHVLECGAQATGGNFAFVDELADAAHPGFPLAEVHADGTSVITKQPGTGGAVTVDTVTAQLLYEIGGVDYAGPDVVTRFDTVRLTPDGPDRVRLDGVRGAPPPAAAKVCLNTLGGFRNATTFVLCGLDIEAKADLVRRQLEAAVGDDGLTWTLARTDRADADTEETASALLHATIRTPDAKRAKAFSRAGIELALASYPGFHVTAPPADGSPFGVYSAGWVPQREIAHVAVLPDGSRVTIPPPPSTVDLSAREAAPPEPWPDEPTRRVPLGRIAGARSGDKGGDANLGVWVRSDAAYRWLAHHLTVDRLRDLLPETAPLPVDRHPLPNLRAVNFVVHGLLGEGVAASTRFDPQAKALGEWLRSRHVDVPVSLLDGAA